MEIFKDLSDPASQAFEKLLNSQLAKVKIVLDCARTDNFN